MSLNRQASSSSRRSRPEYDSQHAVSRNPATPNESDAPADGFFTTLSNSPSRWSRISVASSTRPPSAGGAPDSSAELRRPSIRIRRNSAGSTRLHTPSSQEALTGREDDFQRYRPRSSSQPDPAPSPLSGDFPGGSRRLRRVPQQVALPRLTEEGPRPTMAELGLADDNGNDDVQLRQPPRAAMGAGLGRRHDLDEAEPYDSQDARPQRRSLVERMFRPGTRRRSSGALSPAQDEASTRRDEEYNEELVDWLDIIDPEVQTLSTLTNVQNSLFVPDLGGWVNRRPAYVLSQPESRPPRPVSAARREKPLPEEPRDAIREEDAERLRKDKEEEEGAEASGTAAQDYETEPSSRMTRSNTITSRISESHYAALPHGQTLDGWTAAEKWEMDDHVRHMLHSKRSKFKRQMKGFGQYVRRPLGFFVTLYATLITLFGLAWVLFLIGWIYVGTQQVYAIHIIDSVLVALFAIMGDGLAPFRAVDTYHMIFIARYSRIIAKAKMKKDRDAARERGESGLGAANKLRRRAVEGKDKKTSAGTTSQPPVLQLQGMTTGIPTFTVDGGGGSGSTPNNTSSIDNNVHGHLENNDTSSAAEYDLDPLATDLEDAKSLTSTCFLDADPLTAKQRKSLEHHQKKLSKSHSFYKPHETFTHHSFPLSYLIAIIILLDCHSCLQISLGACTWGIDYHHRPFAITTVILCVSITCNLTAGLVIMFGDRKTRKKDVLELLNRQALTGDAIKKVEKKRKQGQESDSEGGGG